MTAIYSFLAAVAILGIGATVAADTVSKRREGAGFTTAFLLSFFFTPATGFLYGLMFPEKK